MGLLVSLAVLLDRFQLCLKQEGNVRLVCAKLLDKPSLEGQDASEVSWPIALQHARDIAAQLKSYRNGPGAPEE